MPRIVKTIKPATRIEQVPASPPPPRIEQVPAVAPAPMIEEVAYGIEPARRQRVTRHGAAETLAPNVRTTERHPVHNATGDRIGAVWRLACGIWQCTTRNRDGAPRSFDTKTEAEACVRGAVLRAEYRERCIREGRQVEEIEP